MIQKILITKEGKKFFIKNIDEDFHTQFGYIRSEDMKKSKPGDALRTNLGTELMILNPDFIDLYNKITRGPQVVTPKDIGIIITETGIGKNSVVLDAGGGSGALSFFLAHICKKVTTYELREDFVQILEKNKELLGLKNITIKNKNIYEGITEKKIDVITFDLPEPWRALPHAEKALRPGGFLVSYSPNITQIAQFVQAAKKSSIVVLKIKEIIERKWEVDERKLRPFNRMLGHTGFIVFCRKG